MRVLFNLASRDLQSTTAKNIRFVETNSGTDQLREAKHHVQEDKVARIQELIDSQLVL